MRRETAAGMREKGMGVLGAGLLILMAEKMTYLWRVRRIKELEERKHANFSWKGGVAVVRAPILS
jgi:hypothetical protein